MSRALPTLSCRWTSSPSICFLSHVVADTPLRERSEDRSCFPVIIITCACLRGQFCRRCVQKSMLIDTNVSYENSGSNAIVDGQVQRRFCLLVPTPVRCPHGGWSRSPSSQCLPLRSGPGAESLSRSPKELEDHSWRQEAET